MRPHWLGVTYNSIFGLQNKCFVRYGRYAIYFDESDELVRGNLSTRLASIELSRASYKPRGEPAGPYSERGERAEYCTDSPRA